MYMQLTLPQQECRKYQTWCWTSSASSSLENINVKRSQHSTIWFLKRSVPLISLHMLHLRLSITKDSWISKHWSVWAQHDCWWTSCVSEDLLWVYCTLEFQPPLLSEPNHQKSSPVCEPLKIFTCRTHPPFRCFRRMSEGCWNDFPMWWCLPSWWCAKFLYKFLISGRGRDHEAPTTKTAGFDWRNCGRENILNLFWKSNDRTSLENRCNPRTQLHLIKLTSLILQSEDVDLCQLCRLSPTHTSHFSHEPQSSTSSLSHTPSQT